MTLIPLHYKLLAGGLAIAGLFALHVYRVGAAYDKGHAAAVGDRKNSDNAELVTANEKIRKLEKDLGEAVQAGVLIRAEEKLNYAKDLTVMSARIASGDERMRCPAVTVHTPAAPGNPANAGRPAAAEGGYLMPGTVAVIQRIARTDYENVRDYNALAELYNKMRATCNAK